MTTTIIGEIRESMTWSIVLSIVMMVSGVLAIVMPPVAGLTVSVMFGWLFIFAGVLHLGFAWRGDRAATVLGEVALSVLYGLVGLFMLARPLAGLASLTLAVAVYLVVKGFIEGAIAFKLRSLPGSGWVMLDGILNVAIAAMIGAAWPASTAWAVGVLVGVALLSSGLARLMASIAVRRALA